MFAPLHNARRSIQVLRSGPENIYEFGALYFAEKLRQRGARARGPTSFEIICVSFLLLIFCITYADEVPENGDMDGGKALVDMNIDTDELQSAILGVFSGGSTFDYNLT